MSLATTLNTLQRKPVMVTGDMPISLETISGFENLQRMARMFVTVPFVPDTFRAPYTDEKGKRRGCSSIEEAIGCCVVALDMAMRMKANPLAVMQNIYVVHGRPAWTAQFLLATLNNSGRFSTIRYKFQGTQGNDDWGCRAVAKELTTGEIVEGPLVTIGLAKHEGWFKNSSKWQSMPDLMLRYRAVSWFVRAHAPEIAMGLKTEDELRDTIELIPQEDGSWAKPVEEATPSTSVETIRESASPADRGQEDATSDTSAQDKAEARRKAQQELEDCYHYNRSLKNLKQKYTRPALLVIDEWMMRASSDSLSSFLLDVMEGRYTTSSTIFCTQSKQESWHAMLGGNTMAEAIIDRIVQNSLTITLGNLNMRALRNPLMKYKNVKE